MRPIVPRPRDAEPVAVAGASERIGTLDAVRGAAVMGILLMNIVDFAMPGYAYYFPTYYGGAEGANFFAWAANYVLFDGKMRGLFTMMFGASTVLIAERALRAGESPARVTFGRMFWLFVFGMIHTWLIWYGDILVLYSICGMVALLAWRWPVRRLFIAAAVLLLLKLALGAATYVSFDQAQRAATAPGASAETLAEWGEWQAEVALPSVQSQLDGYRGSYADAFETRVPGAIHILTRAHPLAIPDTLALIAIGMALFRLGFFSGAWSKRAYGRVVFWSFLICLPLYLPLVAWNVASGYAPITLNLTEAIHLTFLRPPLSAAYAAIFILFMKAVRDGWLAERLVAAGRMAFSNYLGTSILCTLFFNGYGLGWYGYLERWQCYIVVLAVWAIILLWSKPWLDHFLYGPLEWVWRSLARGERQPFVR